MTEFKHSIAVDGPRNVGKTHLISQIKNRVVYKQPFAHWYTGLYAPVDGHIHNVDRSIFHFVSGMDITLLDTYNNGLLSKGIVFDRLFLSNSVYAVQAGRHKIGQSYDYLSYLVDSRYLENCWSIYITADIVPDNRNKDQWSSYDANKTRDLYLTMIQHLEQKGYNKIIHFKNLFDKDSVTNFLEKISKIE